MRVPFDRLHDTMRRALAATGMADERADVSARLFAEASRDGVASHGLNRFPRFMRMIGRGVVDVNARPERVAGHGALERWDGRAGPGNLNAHAAMTRAIALGRAHGIGCVALATPTTGCAASPTPSSNTSTPETARSVIPANGCSRRGGGASPRESRSTRRFGKKFVVWGTTNRLSAQSCRG